MNTSLHGKFGQVSMKQAELNWVYNCISNLLKFVGI